MKFALGLAACLAAGLSGACLADDLPVTERFSGTTLGFEIKGTFSNVTLTVSGPNSFMGGAFVRAGAPSLDLRAAGTIEDGVYAYHLTAATDDKVRYNTPRLDDGRDASAPAELKSVSASGNFMIKDGSIVPRRTAPEGRADAK